MMTGHLIILIAYQEINQNLNQNTSLMNKKDKMKGSGNTKRHELT